MSMNIPSIIPPGAAALGGDDTPARGLIAGTPLTAEFGNEADSEVFARDDFFMSRCTKPLAIS